MKKAGATELLDKYLKNQCSPAERARVEQWYNSYDEVKTALDTQQHEAIGQALRDSIHQKIGVPDKTKVITFRSMAWRAAASIMILMVIGAGIYLMQNTAAEASTITYTTLAGERKKIILSDSSQVWLNASSTIRFPEYFNGTERTVELVDGEAFFMVKRDEQHPFIVASADGVYTRVLGTSFTVSNYADENEMRITVASGKVAVGRATQHFGQLSKDQQLTFNKITRLTAIHTVPEAHGWINGELVLNGNTLQETATLLKRAYGVQVVIADSSLSALRCSGKFMLDQSAESVIKIICSLHNLTYKSNNDTITITPTKNDARLE